MLSKSRIMRGKQCHKSLWMYKHQPELREISDGQAAIFQSGTDVGLLAQDIFPGGVDATQGFDYPNYKCAAKTLALIAEGVEVIYEATFIFDDVLVAIDVLAKVNGVWNIYEVKSTTKVKSPHIPDSAVQKYVAEGCGIKIGKVFLVHLNREYVRQGALDIQNLFTKADISELVALQEAEIPNTIETLKKVQDLAEMPVVNIGSHCSDPYACDFMNHCWKHVPNYSVFSISRVGSKAWDLFDKGIVEIKDIPKNFPLSANQQNQVDIEKSGEELIKPNVIKDFLSTLTYPLYYLDFETFMPVIPLLDGTRAYDQIVFQYSLHIQKEAGGVCEHKEFLALANGEDPRLMFVKQLIKDCEKKGSIIVYNQAFENTRLKELGEIFPNYQTSLQKIISRVVDLMKPFQQFAYYKKEMQGSYSIKKVLPAIAPELSYSDLEIGDGGTASSAFYNAFLNKVEDETLRTNLLKYCERDTWAMVVLMEKLRELV